MTTAIVVDNYDPTFKNRIRVRVDGFHTEKVEGKYVILDDDLPWAKPAPNTSSTGGTSVPSIGSKVYIDTRDRYEMYYYGQVEVKADLKRVMHDNAESSDTIKVIAYATDKIDGKDYKVNIQYMPEGGLLIESNGHQIYMQTGQGIDIKSNTGAEIKIEKDNTINIVSSKEINLNCKNVNLSDSSAVRGIILSDKLIEKFNNHRHSTARGLSGIPLDYIDPGTGEDVKCVLTEDDLSNEVFINQTNKSTNSGFAKSR